MRFLSCSALSCNSLVVLPLKVIGKRTLRPHVNKYLGVLDLSPVYLHTLLYKCGSVVIFGGVAKSISCNYVKYAGWV